MKKEKQGGIYVLRCPITSEVRYVGQTVNFRSRQYYYGYRAGFWAIPKRLREWIESLETRAPVFEAWLITDDQRLKDRIERRLIKSYGAQLMNTALGGRLVAQPRKARPIFILDDEDEA